MSEPTIALHPILFLYSVIIYNNREQKPMSLDKNTLTELFNEAQQANLVTLIPLLKETPELATASDENGCTLLFNACVKKDLDRVVALISEGANPNQANNFGVHPIEAFMNAATKSVQTADNSNEMMLRVLVESGAYPTDRAILRAEDAGCNEWANYMADKSSCMSKPS
jgi:ankyrin repeat protein